METNIRQPFNPAQVELLNTMAALRTDKDLRELKQAIAKFFAERADRELERLQDEGVVTEEDIASWDNEHMRTPYHSNSEK